MRVENCWVVIPAFNEATVIADVVSSVRTSGFSVVVVDDGSHDDTAERAGMAGADVLRHCLNLGQGAALQTGIAYALQKDAEFVVTFDADGQHQVEDISDLITPILDGEVDIVFGSRFMGTEAIGMSFSRRLLLRAAVLFTRLTTGLKVTDAHCGLRVMNRKCAETLQITQNGMAHATQIPSQIQSAGIRWKEMPIEVVYSDYSRAKGQRVSGSLIIALDILFRRRNG
jgi:glycosyltransferase involved in cell wall biosynthesis